MDALWGKGWNEFKRDRQFDEPIGEKGNNNGVLKYVNLCKFLVFQTDPRVCLGKEITLIQMK